MNSNMVKPEKIGHLHLVDHFTVPLSTFFLLKSVLIFCNVEPLVIVGSRNNTLENVNLPLCPNPVQNWAWYLMNNNYAEVK